MGGPEGSICNLHYLEILRENPFIREIFYYNKPYYNPSKIFGNEAIKIYKRQIKEKNKILRQLEIERIQLLAKRVKSKECIYDIAVEYKEDEIKNIKSNICSLKIKINMALPEEKRNDKIFSFDFEIIKKIPISTIMPNQQSDKKRYLCPFHNEKTPSFFIYKKNDVEYAKCFGCGFQGSVIDVYMTLFNCDFITACKELSKY